jgi:hypothetical protein
MVRFHPLQPKRKRANDLKPLTRKKSTRTPGGKAKWTDDQKLQVAATYVMLGNLSEVALATGISYNTIKVWRYQQWFKDLVLEIRDEDVAQLDANLQRVIKKALVGLEDRLDHGDYQYDPKTGKPIRIPVKAHIALKATSELLTKQDKLRARPEKAELEKTIDDRLAKLAAEFQRFAKARDVTPVVEAIGFPLPDVTSNITDV